MSIDPSGWTYLQKIFSRKVVLWASFMGMLWLLRDFFALFLFTFIISYLASTVVDRLTDFIPRRRLVVVGVFLTFIAAITALCIVIFPAVISEVRSLARDVEQRNVVERSTAAVENFLTKVGHRVGIEPAAIENYIRESVPHLTKSVLANTTLIFSGLVVPVLYFLLAILLAFFMVLDLPNISRQIHKLRESRLSDYYLDVYPGVIAFFSLLGRGLEAQTVIALVNTCMTAIGLAILGLPNIAMLSVIVFVASYIPVLGMWLSTVPMVIVALANSGLGLAVEVVGLVCIVHILEAYVINPRIYGAHMHVHPLMVLIILIIGEHVFGIWGLVLGVPIWTYLWRYAILGKTDELWLNAVSSSNLTTPDDLARVPRQASASTAPVGVEAEALPPPAVEPHGPAVAEPLVGDLHR